MNKDVIRSETKWREESLELKIEDFVYTEEFPEQLRPYSTQILEKLNAVKVLDPACGSGAFPIGVLQKLIALNAINSHLPKREHKWVKGCSYLLSKAPYYPHLHLRL